MAQQEQKLDVVVSRIPSEEDLTPVEGPATWLVALDGSGASWAAWDACMYLHKPEDTVTAVMVLDSNKKDLDKKHKFHEEKIEEELKAVANPPKNFKIERVNKDGMTAGNRIILKANEDNVTYLCTGIRGRKAQGNMNRRNSLVLGRTSDFSLRASKCTSIVVEGDWTAPKQGTDGKLVVAVDGSNNSYKGYLTALLNKKDNDQLTVVHVLNDQVQQNKLPKEFRLESLKAKYAEELKNIPNAEFKIVPGTNVAEVVSEYSEKNGANFLFFGADGMKEFVNGEPFFGSVSDKLVKMATCACVVSQINTIEQVPE